MVEDVLFDERLDCERGNALKDGSSCDLMAPLARHRRATSPTLLVAIERDEYMVRGREFRELKNSLTKLTK